MRAFLLVFNHWSQGDSPTTDAVTGDRKHFHEFEGLVGIRRIANRWVKRGI